MISRSNEPPKYARRLLLSFLRKDIAEEVLGDLQEKFDRTVRHHSIRRARLDYWYQVMNYIRPFAIRQLKVRKQNHISMYRNYVTVGWRNLWRNRMHSIINIGGLALGMTTAILIGLWIYDELTFNNYHQNHERIARVMRNGTINDETFTTGYEPYALAEELREKYGNNFKHVVVTMGYEEHILSKKYFIDSREGTVH